MENEAIENTCRLVRKFFGGKPLNPVELSAVRSQLRPIYEIDSDVSLVENIENFRKMREAAEDVDTQIKAERQIFLVVREIAQQKRALMPAGGVDTACEFTRHLKPLFPKIEDPDAMCRAAALELGKARAK